MKTTQFTKIALVASIFFLQACEHNPLINELDTLAGGNKQNPGVLEPPSDNPCSPDTVYFVNDIQPILMSNCAYKGCHGDGSAEEGVDLTSYASVMSTAKVQPFNPGGSDLYEVITETKDKDVMPKPPANRLSQEQIDKIAKWIQQGALNNSCDGCDTTSVTFSLSISPIIKNSCQGCHSGSSAGGGILLTNYNEIQEHALSGRLYSVVNHSPGVTAMPYKQAKLNQCKIDMIRIWVENGTPNN